MSINYKLLGGAPMPIRLVLNRGYVGSSVTGIVLNEAIPIDRKLPRPERERRD